MNVAGIFNAHQAAADLGIKRVVHASSDCSYGFNFRKKDFLPDYLPLDEDHPQRPQEPYGLSKKVGEEVARSFSIGYGITTIALRIGPVWFPEMAERYRYLVKNPRQRQNSLWLYEHVKDAALAFRLAVEAQGLKKYEAFVISADDNGTEVDTVELVKRHYSDKILFTRELKGRCSLADWTKAKALLGYRPRHSWRDIV